MERYRVPGTGSEQRDPNAHQDPTERELSSWHTDPGVGAFLSLMSWTALHTSGGCGASTFVWEGLTKSLLSAGGKAQGPGAPANALQAWLRDNPASIAALNRCETVPLRGVTKMSGCTTAEHGCLLLPMVSRFGLEGVVCITWEGEMPEEQKISELGRCCQLGAVVLASSRERDMRWRAVCGAMHDLITPLVAARGFTKILLEDRDSTINDAQRDHLGRVLENIERMVGAVRGLRNAGVDG